MSLNSHLTHQKINTPKVAIVITMNSHEKLYKWKDLAWGDIRRDENKWNIQESKWFIKNKTVLQGNKMKNGYDIVDCLGSEKYLVKRQVKPKKYYITSFLIVYINQQYNMLSNNILFEDDWTNGYKRNVNNRLWRRLQKRNER